MKTISKPDWGRKTGFFGYVPTQDIFTLSWLIDAVNFSRFLPIILNIGQFKIPGSYHRFLGITRIGDTMTLYDINPIFSIDIDRLSAIQCFLNLLRCQAFFGAMAL